MSTTTAAPATSWHGLSIANLWQGFGATVVGAGIAAAALSPVLNGNPPTTNAGWLTLAIAIATALQRAFSK